MKSTVRKIRLSLYHVSSNCFPLLLPPFPCTDAIRRTDRCAIELEHCAAASERFISFSGQELLPISRSLPPPVLLRWVYAGFPVKSTEEECREIAAALIALIYKGRLLQRSALPLAYAFAV